MLLIVVGRITFNEQRLINKIKKEIELGNRDENKKKQIFIIHNLINFQTKKQVDEHIKNILLKSASFKLNKIKDINKSLEKKEEYVYFVENESEFQTFHLIMAREGTEAGDYYNQYTYDFLKEKFNNFTLRKPLSIIEEVKNRFVDWSSDILEDKIENDNIEILKDEQNEFEKSYVFKNKEGENKTIIPKACISDELGFSIYRSNGYEPPYNYFIDDKYLILKLEIPGKVEIEDCYANLDTNEIIVKGNKNEDGENIRLKNTRKFGKFNLYIRYSSQIKIAEEDPLEDEEKDTKKKGEDGIFLYKFKLAKRRNAKPSK
jgi:HSP20 family molecular chaperone IbpA